MSFGRTVFRAIGQKYRRLQGLVLPPTSDVSKIDIAYPPLFESVPPTAFRYAVPLAITIGVFTINACDVVLNHWSRIEPPLEDLPSSSPTEPAQTSATPKPKDLNYVLRPLWQRVSLASVYVTMAICASAVFFNSRARLINRLHIIALSKSIVGAGSSKGRTLFFQTCNNGQTRGHVVPLACCKITLAGSGKALIFLEAKGIQGAFRIGTGDAKIDGQVVPPSQIFGHLAKRGIPYKSLKPPMKKK